RANHDAIEAERAGPFDHLDHAPELDATIGAHDDLRLWVGRCSAEHAVEFVVGELGSSSTRVVCLGSTLRCRPAGGFTAMPAGDLQFSALRSAWTASAVIMKITTMTRNTSVSGVMLMSANIGSPMGSGSSGCGAIPIAVLTWHVLTGL